MVYEYILQGSVALITVWLQEGCIHTEEEMTSLLVGLAASVIDKYYYVTV